jgi:hypothetical protein
MNIESFKSWALGKDCDDPFSGCDGGDPGGKAARATWLFGIEWGWSKKDQENSASDHPGDDYSVETQMQWPYNRNAFKLLSCIYGDGIDSYTEYAKLHKPFAKNGYGFFKGNLFPIGFNNIDEWTGDAVAQTGFHDKYEYYDWLRNNRLPVINEWIKSHNPKLFIGVGITFANDFMAAVGAHTCSEHKFKVNGHTKRILIGNVSDFTFSIIPHLSGGANGLNSDEAIRKAGDLIKHKMLYR